MVGIIKALAGLLAIASYSVSLCESTSIGDLEKIDKKLVVALPDSTDYEENFKEIEKLLEQKSQKGCTFWTKSYSNTLQKLVMLKSIRCFSDEHLNVLREINAAFGENAHKRASLNRIRELVYQLTLDYDDECQNISFKIVGSKRKLEVKAALESIDKNLVGTVPNSEFGQNLEALKQMLDSESKKGDHANKVHMDTMKELISLGSSGCTNKIYKSLKSFNRIALDDEVRDTSFRPIRRVSAFLYDLSVEHAKKCLDAYNDVFESKVTQLDPKQVEYVETFHKQMEDYDHSRTKDFNNVTPKVTLKEFLFGAPISWYAFRGHVYEALEANVKGSDESKYLKKIDNEIVDEKGLKQVFNKYLVEPCRYYFDELGPEVFRPAFYDARWNQEVDESIPEFYQAWARYKLCRQLLVNEPKAFEGVLEVANRKN